MAVKLLSAVACLLALTQVIGVQVNSDGKIKMSVYTTAGCGDTVRFIRDQLAPTYRQYGKFLDVKFIPWGKTTWGQGAGDVISCQFGRNDCWSNHLQRCVLSLLEGNQTAQVDYMTCEFTAPRPSFTQGSYQCVQNIGLNLNLVDYCVANNHDVLARQAQAASVNAIAAFNFVPTIVYNDVINRTEHQEALRRLSSQICFALAENPETGISNCQL